MSNFVEVKNISLAFKNSKQKNDHILKDLSLEFKRGEFTCLLGPSGCGKSTLLGLIAGFVKADAGEILVDGTKVTRPDISRTLVFQEYALFPWLNVIDNVAFGLYHSVPNREERYFVASKYLKMVGLLNHARSSIAELSGGMKQRVALARALVVEPQLLLMDEPFGALDDHSRTTMQKELVRIWQGLGHSIVFVTHSVDEALLLADRVIVMNRESEFSSTGVVKADIRITDPRPRDLSQLADYRAAIQDTLYNKVESGSHVYDVGL